MTMEQSSKFSDILSKTIVEMSLVQRVAQLEHHIKRLEAIIDSTCIPILAAQPNTCYSRCRDILYCEKGDHLFKDNLKCNCENSRGEKVIPLSVNASE